MKSKLRNTKNSISKQYSEFINAEIRRRIMLMAEKSATCFDACFLFTMHQKFGWGKRRLRKLFEAFDEVMQDMMNYYECAPITTQTGQFDVEFYAVENLKKIGVDIEKWRKERSNWKPENDEVWKEHP